MKFPVIARYTASNYVTKYHKYDSPESFFRGMCIDRCNTYFRDGKFEVRTGTRKQYWSREDTEEQAWESAAIELSQKDTIFYHDEDSLRNLIHLVERDGGNAEIWINLLSKFFDATPNYDSF